MISKEKRDEAWKKNKEYLDNPDTIEDLRPLCQNCKLWKGDHHNWESCRGKPCMELWLSNEYQEWASLN